MHTPDPLQWDCFRFGIIQGPDSFTYYASIDHVHVDAMVVGVTLIEFYLMYTALVAGNPPIALPEVEQLPRLLRPAADVHVRAHSRVTSGPRMDAVRRTKRRQHARLPAATG